MTDTLAARIRSARDLREKAPEGPWTFTGDVESVAITIASDPYADIRGEVPDEAYQSWAHTGNFIAAAGSLPWDELAAAVDLGAAWERAERALPEGWGIYDLINEGRQHLLHEARWRALAINRHSHGKRVSARPPPQP